MYERPLARFGVKVLVGPHSAATALRAGTGALCAADSTSRARQPHATGGCLRHGMAPAGSIPAT